MRRIWALVAVALVSIGASAPAASARADAPYCGITWGSLLKQKPDMSQRQITNLRAGRHTCFDRLVVDLRHAPPGVPAGRIGYRVEYVPVIREDGSGIARPVAGAADLQIAVNAPAHNLSGVPTYRPADRFHAVDVTGFTTFRQVEFLGTFEGVTTIGLGVRARLPFRVFVLSGPDTGARLVVDVAHHW